MKKAQRLVSSNLKCTRSKNCQRTQRRQDEEVQGSMRYKMLSFLGIGDVLESDSHDVRVKKLIPMQLYESELRAKYDCSQKKILKLQNSLEKN